MRHAILGLCIAVAACAPPLNTDAAARQAVRAVESELQAAFKARDAAKVAALYAADADIVIPEQPVRTGADQLKATENDLKDPNFALEFVNARTEVAGDMAFTRGRYTVTYTNPGNGEPAQQRGNYLTVFRKGADGVWKIVADISTPGPRAR